jgi:hypothetical protein
MSFFVSPANSFCSAVKLLVEKWLLPDRPVPVELVSFYTHD